MEIRLRCWESLVEGTPHSTQRLREEVQQEMRLLKRMYLWSNVSGLRTRRGTGMNSPSSGLSKIITVEWKSLGEEKAFDD